MAPARGETREFTSGHARFLVSLGKVRFRAADFEHSGCGKGLQRSLHDIKGSLEEKDFELLSAAYRDCETALLYWTGPYVLSQGDFAPWNIRTLASQLFVSDWGRARADASPLDDVLHYLMVQRALSGRPLSTLELQAAMARAQAFARHAYPEWSWRPQVVGALTLVYLLGSVLHRRAAGGSYWKLIEQRSAWMPASHQGGF